MAKKTKNTKHKSQVEFIYYKCGCCKNHESVHRSNVHGYLNPSLTKGIRKTKTKPIHVIWLTWKNHISLMIQIENTKGEKTEVNRKRTFDLRS